MTSPLDLLGRVPLFRELGDDDLRWIAEATRPCTFGEGEHLFEIGEPGRSLYILTEGTVQVLQPSRPTDFQLARMGPGDFLGEMALLNDAPRSATVTAICDVEALALEKPDFRRLLVERPSVALKILEVMSSRIRDADEQISSLSGQAVRDTLSGLLNRIALDERLEEETARTRRYGGTFSLILLDLRDFTSVVDTLGHDIGDRILTWVGRLLREHTRTSDVPFRIEHNVFAVLCPSTGLDVAKPVADRLSVLVSEAKAPIDVELTLTMSAGSATCPEHGQEGPGIYLEAQRALMVAKARGR